MVCRQQVPNQVRDRIAKMRPLQFDCYEETRFWKVVSRENFEGAGHFLGGALAPPWRRHWSELAQVLTHERRVTNRMFSLVSIFWYIACDSPKLMSSLTFLK